MHMDFFEKISSSSKDQQLSRIYRSLVTRIHEFVEFQRYHLSRYAEIGMALSGEEDTGRLLEMIVFEAREITGADAGSLYMVNDDATHLNFVILQNDTMRTLLGGVSGERITLPPVPLYVNGQENHAHVSSHVALTGKIINIPDVYESSEFDLSGTRNYDRTTGYLSKSMLVIPMRNHENVIIGVLQLLNALDHESGEVVEFFDEHVGLIASLASQAAVTLTKTRLILDLKKLFDAFTKAIATAIEEKSRYTGGHIARVSKLSILIAEKVDESTTGPFRDIHFSPLEIEELRLAAWLHDIGKIVTPEYVVDKSSKLETIADRIHIIDARFDYIAKSIEADCLAAKLERLHAGNHDSRELDAQCQSDLATLEADREFVRLCNSPTEFMTDESLARLRALAAKTYLRKDKPLPYLTADELKNLSIRRGTLNSDERDVIHNHAVVTYKMLSKLPFPRNLARVPEFAAQHHEKIDGTGYPFGLSGKDLSLQAKIMAVADIFEALTARDRPYKTPMNLSQAIKILGEMKDQGHIDPDVHDLLVSSGIIPLYAAQELNPGQVDMPLETGTDKPKQDPLRRKLSKLMEIPPPRPEDLPPSSKPRVLLVDDSVSARMLLAYYLKDSVCSATEAGSGLEAIESYIKNPYDIVLLDLELPNPDGYATATAIREWESRHGLPPKPILAMTAHFYRDDAERRERAGFSGLLDRPFTRKKILDAIAKALKD